MNEESKSDRLARVLAASLTEQNGRPTKVVIRDDFAYIEQGIDPDTGATVVHRYVVPPEAYDALAVSEEHGGQGFGINLLSPLGERAWPNEGSNP